MTRARNYFAWQHRLVTKELGRRVVEIGCGIGNFTGLLLDREAVAAVDIEPACIERLRERYPEQANLYPVCAGLGDAEVPELDHFQADSCVCLNVLEHIEDDIGALQRMAGWLIPGGVLVLILPAFPSLYGPIDRQLGHCRRYTKRSVLRLAEATGLEVRTSHYMNPIGFFGWWINAHILRREAQSEAQIEFFDRFVVPVSSRFEASVHPPFGQSLFVVLRKP
jgi:SAM-dependent methyltransferase